MTAGTVNCGEPVTNIILIGLYAHDTYAWSDVMEVAPRHLDVLFPDASKRCTLMWICICAMRGLFGTPERLYKPIFYYVSYYMAYKKYFFLDSIMLGAICPYPWELLLLSHHDHRVTFFWCSQVFIYITLLFWTILVVYCLFYIQHRYTLFV